MGIWSIFTRSCSCFYRHRIAGIVVGHVVVVAVLAATWLSAPFAAGIYGAFAQVPCATNNHLADPAPVTRALYQHMCIAGSSADMLQHMSTMTGGAAGGAAVATPYMLTTITAMRGISNPFPYGQCTWWASQRYFQLSGVYVPWTSNADAYQWSDRARDFHWSVSAQPQAGAIVNLQANIQGASNLGHVGVVERVLSNGHVLASNMNWGPDFSQVSDVEFTPGPGVTFITAR